MEHRQILVTGAAGGLGRALCQQLARKDTTLILVDRTVSLARSIASQLPGETHSYAADFRKADAVARSFASIKKKHPDIDLLVLNAGIDRPHDLTRPDWQNMSDHLQINVLANAAILSELVPNMIRKKPGQVVAIASQAAFYGFPYESSYCTSKAALKSFIESARAELRPHGIRFTTIFPGYLKTDMVAGNAFKITTLMTPEKAATRMIRAIKKGKRTFTFPKATRLQILLLQMLPAWLTDRLVFLGMKKKADIF